MMKLPNSMIINMDETNVDFDQPSSLTLANRGGRTVSVTVTGSSYGCIALLAVTMSVEELPAFVAFKVISCMIESHSCHR
jgi:hypothetical protein